MAPERHETQYFEMFCNRGIYHQGWSAVTKQTARRGQRRHLPRSTTMSGSSTTRARTGRSRRTSPGKRPEKLRELQRLWLIEAVTFNVLPIDDRQLERFVPDLAGGRRSSRAIRRPCMARWDTVGELRDDHQEQVVSGHLGSEVPAKGAEGVIIAQGARSAAGASYAKGGKAKYY